MQQNIKVGNFLKRMMLSFIAPKPRHSVKIKCLKTFNGLP